MTCPACCMFGQSRDQCPYAPQLKQWPGVWVPRMNIEFPKTPGGTGPCMFPWIAPCAGAIRGPPGANSLPWRLQRSSSWSTLHTVSANLSVAHAVFG